MGIATLTLTDTAYSEYPAPAQLNCWVHCIWTRECFSKGEHTHRVLPDGCIDILFELGGALAGTSNGGGMMMRPLLVTRTGAMRIVGIRFKPGGAAAFFRE